MAAARVVKEHDERRGEILGAAQLLFNQHGYDNTSVNSIIEHLGISKGTFYHYFSSKEELLDALVESFTDDIMARVVEATHAKGLTAIERMNAYFSVAGTYKAANTDIILMLLKAMYRPENILLRHKLTRVMIVRAGAELSDIIQQGVDDGEFDAENAVDTAELILYVAVAMRETTAQLWLQLAEDAGVWDELVRKTRSCERAIERLLGSTKGSIRLVARETLEMFKNAIAKK